MNKSLNQDDQVCSPPLSLSTLSFLPFQRLAFAIKPLTHGSRQGSPSKSTITIKRSHQDAARCISHVNFPSIRICFLFRYFCSLIPPWDGYPKSSDWYFLPRLDEYDLEDDSDEANRTKLLTYSFDYGRRIDDQQRPRTRYNQDHSYRRRTLPPLIKTSIINPDISNLIKNPQSPSSSLSKRARGLRFKVENPLASVDKLLCFGAF